MTTEQMIAWLVLEGWEPYHSATWEGVERDTHWVYTRFGVCGVFVGKGSWSSGFRCQWHELEGSIAVIYKRIQEKYHG